MGNCLGPSGSAPKSKTSLKVSSKSLSGLRAQKVQNAAKRSRHQSRSANSDLSDSVSPRCWTSCRSERTRSLPLEIFVANRSTPLQSPNMGNLGKSIFFWTQKWTFSGQAIWITFRACLITPLLSESLLKGELNTSGGLFKWLQEGPPKVQFWVPKMVFPRFPVSGFCRGSAGSQDICSEGNLTKASTHWCAKISMDEHSTWRCRQSLHKAPEFKTGGIGGRYGTKRQRPKFVGLHSLSSFWRTSWISGWLRNRTGNQKPEPSEPYFPKPKAEPEPPEPFSRNRNRNRNRPFLLNSTEPQTNPFSRGTARTENRNRLNRSIPKP